MWKFIAQLTICFSLMPSGNMLAQVTLSKSDAFRDVKILNNFCWELLNLEEPAGLDQTVRFSVPIDRWIFIQTTAESSELHTEARIHLGFNHEPLLVHTQSGNEEAMCFLTAGTYTLKPQLRGDMKITRIIVRAIPALQYALYGESCHVYPYGPYDWNFLEKYILADINVMISNRHVVPKPAHIGAWKAQGRRWIDDATAAFHLLKRDQKGKMYFDGSHQEAVDAIYDNWARRTWALRHHQVDGIIIDEIIGRNVSVYDAYRDAAARLYTHPLFLGKTVDLYVATKLLFEDARGKELAQFCVDHGGYLAQEWYLQELPSEAEAQARIDEIFVTQMRQWEATLPGVTPRIVATLACETAYPENADRYPNVDFKVFMDMQMHTLATRREFFALGGFQWYKSGYTDEEVMRWSARLYRHYCIEGHRNRLTHDPYELSHIANPDFAEGTAGWQIHPAATGSVETEHYQGYGQLQGRWGKNMGDQFLLMRRSPDRPNVFSQDIKYLEPGRLYVMKMISSDYQDLLEGKSFKSPNAVSITIDDVDVLAEPDKSFQFTYQHSFGDKRDKFDAEHPYWMNLHRRIFRALKTTAKLTVTDWQNAQGPGGRNGQELMFNFIQIQPYLE